MDIQDIKKITVISAGIMGSQIAEILSRLGEYEVILYDIKEEMVQKGLRDIDERLEAFFVAKGKLTPEQKQQVLG